jgi:hypothetical protein
MIDIATLQPVSVVDKNGKITTVHRRVNQFGMIMPMSEVPPPTGRAAKKLAPSVAARLTDTTMSQDRDVTEKAMLSESAGADAVKHTKERVKRLDVLTLRVIAASVRNNLIGQDRLSFIEGMTNDEALEYVTIVSTVHDLDIHAVFTQSLFNGLRPVITDKAGYERYGRLDLSTDENIENYGSIMRFGLRFLALNSHTGEETALKFEDVFTLNNVSGQIGQVLGTDLWELVARRPQDIDAICDLMRVHPIKHAGGIEMMLDHGATALSEGGL